MNLNNLKLQFITHYTASCSYIESARIALQGGCRWIQLRMKDADEVLLERTAITLQAMCRDYGATFIIDDNVLLAKRIGADGVHLGKDDMSIGEARLILGEGFIIGSTVNSFDDIKHVLASATPDYFGCGPFRYTTTKRNLAPVLGLEGYREIVGRMRECDISIPLVAIGGITKEDIPELLECGVGGIALSGSVINAEDPIQRMREVAELFKK
ncbi:MAG: thiamine phosphate synthase [Alistipes sp.]|nr:thiamine phosphate synthase [Alistipes sp.]